MVEDQSHDPHWGCGHNTWLFKISGKITEVLSWTTERLSCVTAAALRPETRRDNLLLFVSRRERPSVCQQVSSDPNPPGHSAWRWKHVPLYKEREQLFQKALRGPGSHSVTGALMRSGTGGGRLSGTHIVIPPLPEGWKQAPGHKHSHQDVDLQLSWSLIFRPLFFLL